MFRVKKNVNILLRKFIINRNLSKQFNLKIYDAKKLMTKCSDYKLKFVNKSATFKFTEIHISKCNSKTFFTEIILEFVEM